MKSHDVGLLVLDTLARCFVGHDENSVKDVGAFIHAVDSVRVETGADVLLVHHAGWNSQHMRGSTALPGAAEAVLGLCQKKSEVLLTCEKQKDAEPFPSVKLILTPCAESCVIRPAQSIQAKSLQEALTTDQSRPSGLTASQRKALLALPARNSAGIDVASWREIAELPKRTLQAARSELKSRKLIESFAHGMYRLTEAGVNFRALCIDETRAGPAKASVPSGHSSVSAH
jgi:AAA domain